MSWGGEKVMQQSWVVPKMYLTLITYIKLIGQWFFKGLGDLAPSGLVQPSEAMEKERPW